MKIKCAAIASSELRDSREFKSSTIAHHSQKKKVIALGKVYHILKPLKIAYIQNQKQTSKHKTENACVQKMFEFTPEILNSDHVFKNEQNIKTNNNNKRKKSIISCLFLDVVRH